MCIPLAIDGFLVVCGESVVPVIELLLVLGCAFALGSSGSGAGDTVTVRRLRLQTVEAMLEVADPVT